MKWDNMNVTCDIDMVTIEHNTQWLWECIHTYWSITLRSQFHWTCSYIFISIIHTNINILFCIHDMIYITDIYVSDSFLKYIKIKTKPRIPFISELYMLHQNTLWFCNVTNIVSLFVQHWYKPLSHDIIIHSSNVVFRQIASQIEAIDDMKAKRIIWKSSIW